MSEQGIRKRKVNAINTLSPYISPNELAERWRCARSSVDRIARRAGLTRLCLGSGARGMIRYIREEVERLEHTRRA